MEQDQPEPQVPRSFARFIDNLADGDCERDCATELFELLAVLRREADSAGGVAKGALTLKLSFEVSIRDEVEVKYEIVAKEPLPIRPKGHVWLDRNGQVVFQNPRQRDLPFREVVTGGSKREVSGRKDVREI